MPIVLRAKQRNPGCLTKGSVCLPKVTWKVAHSLWDDQLIDAAWEFIKYFNGDEYATEYYTPKSLNNNIGAPLSRMIKEYSGYKLESFYKLKPNLDSSITSYALMNKSPNFELRFRSTLLIELTQVINGKKTIEKATAAIQSSTQTFADKLTKAKTEKK